ncbi:hypothetical protein BJ138DRAFT_1112620 [Hygrophoropsis aurantiaca]|uniref:Uncharacterized protein n=1 Tax=Hygrophoropsis aurantiaca TaxID=72124 RepID=A0ACB8AG61_9AGAM|nr:hypothetical protein BJ138DRAFT_1112620 [Hygrophoropsis aurantiaca]
MSAPFSTNLRDILQLAPTKSALTLNGFVSDILPPIFCYFVTAVLVLIPRTHWIRLALWPITVVLALRATSSTDFALNDPRQAFWNIDLVLSMFCITTRTLQWILMKNPPKRIVQDREATPSRNTYDIIKDALDLMINLRGHDWNWSGGLYIPPETRPTSSRLRFILATLISCIIHGLTCGALHTAVQTFSPDGFATHNGGTIFDASLPAPVRYLRSSIISTMTAFAIYSVLRCGYELMAIGGIVVLGQEPHQWPPAFEKPWISVSLREFWGKRWHQWFRGTFLFLGARPLSYIGGRVGGIIGAFLASAVFHHTALYVLDENAKLWNMIVPFAMMGLGMVLERVYTMVSGRKVGGWLGWVWTMFWLVLWGNPMVDAWAQAGMMGCSTILDSTGPLRTGVVYLVKEFDDVLHQYTIQ